MKKILSLLSLFIAFVFVGCSCAKPFYMDDNLYNNTTENVFIDLKTFADYQALINNKSSFALYVHEESCGGCQKFSPVLTEYLESNNLSIYRIDVSIAKSEDSTISKKMEGTPALFLFNKGEYVTFLDSHSSKSIEKNAFKSVEGFEKWFTKYVILK